MKKNTGFTLIEIMIALVIGLIVVGATISIYIATVGSSSSTIKSTRLNHDMESVMTLMINDIKRAGYWGLASDGNANNNPFTQSTTDIQIHNNSCILYSYDGDGNLGTPDATEYYGFRLVNNRIQVRISGNTTAAAGCDDDGSNWQEFMETSGNSQLFIESLQFSFAPITNDLSLSNVDLNATSKCYNQTNDTYFDRINCSNSNGSAPALANANGNYIIQNRLVNIRMVGYVNNDRAVKKVLLGTVEVRNNRICIWDGTDCP